MFGLKLYWSEGESSCLGYTVFEYFDAIEEDKYEGYWVGK
jgi:hypothetical protein